MPQLEELVMDLLIDLVVLRHKLGDVDFGLARSWRLISMITVKAEHQIVHNFAHDWHVGDKLLIIGCQCLSELYLDKFIELFGALPPI